MRSKEERLALRWLAIALVFGALLAVHWVFWSLSLETRTTILTALSAAYCGYLLVRRAG